MIISVFFAPYLSLPAHYNTAYCIAGKFGEFSPQRFGEGKFGNGVVN